MTSDDLKAANLRENPFRSTPSERVTVWAGHQELRSTLEDVISSVRSDQVGLTECIVLYGELGTGKSHALRFFQNFIESKQKDFRSKCVYLPTLRVANKVTFLELYRKILERVGQADLQNFSKLLVERVNKEVNRVKAATLAEEYQRAQEGGYNLEKVWQRQATELVLGSYAPSYRVFECLEQGAENAWFYISASGSKLSNDDLTQLQITGPVDSDFDAIEHLGMLVSLMCGTPLLGEEPYWKAFYLFLDEVDTITELESKAMVGINQSLRGLLNACPENFCLLLGLTGDAALVEAMFSMYLLSRLTRDPIPIPSLDQVKGIEFLREVLRVHRLDESKSDEWHPFLLESIAYIVSNTTDKTPRKLFANCRRVLELSANEGTIKSGKKISKDDAERMLV